jgi:hypothetical protein
VSAAVVTLLSASVLADRQHSPATNPTWKAECGSCHMAYPPSLLPADAWRAVMTGLDRHFGVDAGVDAKTAAEIGAFLEGNAGRSRGAMSVPTPRITETAWFRHEHGEVDAGVWTSAQVKSPSNCLACHRAAEQGDFDEDSVVLPR